MLVTLARKETLQSAMAFRDISVVRLLVLHRLLLGILHQCQGISATTAVASAAIGRREHRLRSPSSRAGRTGRSNGKYTAEGCLSLLYFIIFIEYLPLLFLVSRTDHIILRVIALGIVIGFLVDLLVSILPSNQLIIIFLLFIRGGFVLTTGGLGIGIGLIFVAIFIVIFVVDRPLDPSPDVRSGPGGLDRWAADLGLLLLLLGGLGLGSSNTAMVIVITILFFLLY